jgi:hypothetical protein
VINVTVTPLATGYSASVAHNQTPRTCSVVVGDGSAQDGVITCT